MAGEISKVLDLAKQVINKDEEGSNQSFAAKAQEALGPPIEPHQPVERAPEASLFADNVIEGSDFRAPVADELVVDAINDPGPPPADLSATKKFSADTGQQYIHPEYGDAKLVPVFDHATGKFIDRPEGYATVTDDPNYEAPPEQVLTPEQETAQGLLEQNILKTRNIEIAEADLEYEEARKLQNRREEIDQENAHKLAADTDDIETAINDYERANADLANLKIDPGQYWASRSTGQKMAGALALMLSSYQMGKAGNTGKNPMMAAYDKAVADDINVQMKEYNEQKGGVARKKTLVGFYRDRLGNDQQVVAAVKLKATQDAISKVELFKVKNKGSRAAINADQKLVELRVQEAKYKAEMAQKSLEKDYKARKDDRATRALNTRIYQNGKFLMADTPEQARDAKRTVSKQKAAKSAVADINSYMNEYGVTDYLNPTKAMQAKLDAAQVSLKSAFRIMLVGPGTISEQDLKIIKEAVPKLGGAMGSITGKDLNRYNALLERYMISSDLELEGLAPGYQGSKSYMDMQPGAYKKKSGGK